MSRRDPIVEEVRKHRAQIAREHGNDMEAMLAVLEGDDPEETAPLVSLPPKRVPRQTAGRKARATRRHEA